MEPRLQRQRVRVQLLLPEKMPAARADRTQLEMVLHNLLTNAVDALAGAADRPREIRIRGEHHGGRLVLGVHDSGPGVSADAFEQLFEPFNTTKADGMGLGLAISRNLMRAQGGDLIYRRSEELQGACFEVQLNVFEADAEEGQG